MDSNSKIKEVLSWGVENLREVSQSPGLDAELLLANALKATKLELIKKSEERIGDNFEKYKEYIERRKNFEPVAYIIGKKEFWGLDFIVTPAVLIPRPETEVLVEWALEEMEERREKPLTILDCGTGSGCIIVSLAVEARRRGIDAEFYALDVSEETLRIAKQNALFHEVEINFLKSDWYSNIPKSLRFDLIVSNPPYIALGDKNLSHETMHEPRHALFAGGEGLDAIKLLISNKESFLKDNGALLIEIGYDHAKSLNGEFRADLAGIKRVVKV